jgi:hypothetical protein
MILPPNCTANDVVFADFTNEPSTKQTLIVSGKMWWNFTNGIRALYPTQQILFNTLQWNKQPQSTICVHFAMSLLHSNDFFTYLLQQEKDKLKFDGQKTIGIHIRNGKDMNQGQDGRQTFNFVDYMKYAKLIQKKHNINTIYLASDDQQTFSEIAYYPEFHFIFHKVDFTASTFIQSKQTLFSLFLLAETKFFICTLSSNFSVLAKLLSQNQTIISLDGYYHRNCELLKGGTIYQ